MNFVIIEDELPYDKYYWKVIAKNKFDQTEGFNTKNILHLIKASIK